VVRFTVGIIDNEDHGTSARAFGRDIEVEAQIFSMDEHRVIFYANPMDNATGVAAFPTPRVIAHPSRELNATRHLLRTDPFAIRPPSVGRILPPACR
jgi:hypothetical protein